MMTNNEKEMIRELRMQGLGYGKVAERTGIKLETVKSFCRRHGSVSYTHLHGDMFLTKSRFLL